MFDLESEIKAWRRELSRAGISPEAIDELTAHVRDEMAVLTRSGVDGAEAFRTTTARAGDAKSLSREFHKSSRARKLPVTLAVWLWVAVVVAFFVIVMVRVRRDENPDLLYAGHFISLTIGYITACISGIFGLSHVALRHLGQLSSHRRETINHGIKSFNWLAVIFVLLGLATGLIWNFANPSAYSNVPPYPEFLALVIVSKLREYGSFAVALWLVGTMALQLRRPAAGALVPMSIAGNLLVGLAWFGPFIFWNDLQSYYGIKTLWPVNAIMILHLVVLGLAFVRRHGMESGPREARS